MADQSQPIYTWRQNTPKGGQGNNYFGSPSFGQALNGGVAAAGGAPSQIAPTSHGFNVPGGDSSGFNSPSFNAAAPATPTAPTATTASPAAPPGSQPAQPASFSDALRNNPLSQPLIRSASENIMQNLNNSQGPSMGSMFALNEYNKGESEALRQAKESSALNGRAFTGQISGDVNNELTNKLIPARQNFLGQLQGQEEQQNIARQQNAFQNLNTMAGLGQQGEIASNQLQSAEKQQANQLASTEKVAFAGLDVQKQQLAQTAMQFNSKQDFDKWALDQNLSQADKELVWKSTEAEKDRQLTQGQGELNRTLQQYVADKGFQIDDKKLTEQVKQFNSQQDFQKWATQAGLDADTQKQVWQANQNDIQRKQDLGMQLTAGEQALRMEGLKEAHDTAMADLGHVLNLDTMDKQQANEVALKKMDQSFTSLMTDKGYSHDEAMAATKQEYAKQLETMGFDHDTAMQASDQWFKGQQADADRNQSKYLAEAQMAQTYDMFNQDLQQKYNFQADDVTLAHDKLSAESQQWAQSLGLDEQKFNLLKGTQEFQNLSDTTSTLMAMAGDNPDMLQFAAENFYKGMGNLKNADGSAVMSPDQVKQGTLAIKAGTFKDTKSFTDWAASSGYTPEQIAKAQENVPPSDSNKAKLSDFSNFIGKVGSFTDPAQSQKLVSDISAVKSIVDGFSTKTNDADSLPGGWIDYAGQRLKSKGQDKNLSNNLDRKMVGSTSTHASYEATQAGADYAIYAHLIQSGIGEDQAPAALQKLLGKPRADAAIALEG